MASGKNKYPRYLATRVLNFHWTYFGAISETRQQQKNQLKHKKGPYLSLSVLTRLTDTISTYVRACLMFDSSVPSSNVPIGDNEFRAPFLCLYKQMAHVFLHSLSISNIPKWTCSRNINFEFSNRPRGIGSNIMNTSSILKKKIQQRFRKIKKFSFNKDNFKYIHLIAKIQWE